MYMVLHKDCHFVPISYVVFNLYYHAICPILADQ